MNLSIPLLTYFAALIQQCGVGAALEQHLHQLQRLCVVTGRREMQDRVTVTIGHCAVQQSGTSCGIHARHQTQHQQRAFRTVSHGQM